MDDDFAALIDAIGSEMVCCTAQCPGIVCKQKTGQIPRCLFLELEKSTGEKRDGKRGVVIVGLNPGAAKDTEKQHYLMHGSADEHPNCNELYDAVKGWMRLKGLVSEPYYLKLYKFLGTLNSLPSQPGITGPILWTELVKCESTPEEGKLPVQTISECTKGFLFREMELVPCDWPIIAAGKDAYDFLRIQFPRRKIIGVPHPTGWGNEELFHRLFDPYGGNSLVAKFADEADNVLRGWKPHVWLKSSR